MFLDISSKVARGIGVECGCWVEVQRLTEAEHNWPIPKFFGNQPLATKVFGEKVGVVIYLKMVEGHLNRG